MARPSRNVDQLFSIKGDLFSRGLRRLTSAVATTKKDKTEKHIRDFIDKVALVHKTTLVKIIDSDKPPIKTKWKPLSKGYARSKGHGHRYIKNKILRNSFRLKRETKGKVYVASIGIPSGKTYPNGMAVWEVLKMLDKGSKAEKGSRARPVIPARPILKGAWEMSFLQARKEWRGLVNLITFELKTGYENFK